MIDPQQIMWPLAGVGMPSLGEWLGSPQTWGTIPAWFGGLSLLLAFALFVRDRRSSDRSQIEQVAVWLTTSQPTSTDTNVESRLHAKNSSDGAVTIDHVEAKAYTRWNLETGQRFTKQHKAIQFKEWFHLGPGESLCPELVEYWDVCEHAPGGATLLLENGASASVRWFIAVDNAGRQWDVRRYEGKRAKRIRWYSRRRDGYPPRWSRNQAQSPPPARPDGEGRAGSNSQNPGNDGTEIVHDTGARAACVQPELPISFWNPLQGGGRSKVWAEDVKANIAYIKFKLDTIKNRNDAVLGGTEGSNSGECVRGRELHIRGLMRTAASARTGVMVVLRNDMRKQSERDTISSVEIESTCMSVSVLLGRAVKAATGQDPRHCPIVSWWSGAGTEAAFKNIHYAEAAVAQLYNEEEMRAEIPEAVRRASAALPESDPTRKFAATLMDGAKVVSTCSARELSAIIATGHEAADRIRSRLRTFRNTLLTGSLLLTLVLAGTISVAVFVNPYAIPLCFTQDPPPDLPNLAVSCPTGSGRSAAQFPSVSDPAKGPEVDHAPVVALFGLIGGALSAGVFIRGMYSNPTPYNVAIPLALLKLPVGALAALVGTVLLGGDFVPGFTAIDKPPQILAYALVFGFAQQLFTRALDRRAENLIADLPTKAKEGDSGSSGTTSAN